MGDSILKDKSFQFALHIISLYKELYTNNEYVMSKQLLRCGTSIGANIAEANKAQTLADFSAKMYIALKEANETEYWLQLLTQAGYIGQEKGREILNECDEIVRMLVATTKKTAPRLI